MAQASMTVRMDSELKKAFDSLCSQFGMSANTAMNVFANAVVRSRRIPFEIEASEPSPQSREGLAAFRALRAEAERNGIQDMTLREINEEIRLAREEEKERKRR
ncbi:MAG: type II toxin-antitoxin system RelB/DinJ family antitoxin [Fibrobacterales bacterium]|nr:type II toxin-antitoxin system RelB/DinJ family antitoxin [Fibrobacterales bacterium]